MRARFDQRQELKNEYELLIKFDEHTYHLFGLYQQAVVGDVNVPSIVILGIFQLLSFIVFYAARFQHIQYAI